MPIRLSVRFELERKVPIQSIWVAVGASPTAPERFDPRDLWIVVDPTHMEIAVRQIAEGGL